MPLRLQTCATLQDAAAALQAPGARYMGGGTLAVRASKEGDLTVTTLVRSNDAALALIEITGDIASIGASVTMATIARHPGLAVLAGPARTIGGPAVRNMATVGGNLFAPSPYGDFSVALLALDAMVHYGDTTQPLEAFLEARDGVGKGTIIRAVSVPLPPPDQVRFLKVSRVKPKGISVLSIAARLEEEAGLITGARIALGGMAGHAIRARAAERALIGRPRTREGISDALAVAGQGTAPPTDAIASAWYRSEVLPVHLGRLLLS